uniref:Uncharacterized protein n=1 Tax=Palpitomonas bilix TaxID=652834 RepID=A0A7S3GJT1_9EUKA|mmetsp:Transcript_6564/g.16325  ORF Transcript_6564/g.16325 Transcript_6564/m.16325 type:complete len:167 (+) Transcript_6564:191-691(+)
MKGAELLTQKGPAKHTKKKRRGGVVKDNGGAAASSEPTLPYFKAVLDAIDVTEQMHAAELDESAMAGLTIWEKYKELSKRGFASEFSCMLRSKLSEVGGEESTGKATKKGGRKQAKTNDSKKGNDFPPPPAPLADDEHFLSDSTRAIRSNQAGKRTRVLGRFTKEE